MRWMGTMVLLLGAGFAVGQDTVAMPEKSVGEALRGMATRASTVFVGQVERVDRKGGVVEVRFRVESVVAGNAGGEFVMRQWGGLWPQGMQRYVPGERAMVFVQAESAAGLTTPVNGAEGVVPVLQASAVDAPVLDVTRVATRVERGVTESLESVGDGVLLNDAVALVKAVRQPVWKEPRRIKLPVRVFPAVPVGGSPVLRTPVVIGGTDRVF